MLMQEHIPFEVIELQSKLHISPASMHAEDEMGIRVMHRVLELKLACNNTKDFLCQSC